MSSIDVETFLARLYTDRNALDHFLSDPIRVLNSYPLAEEEKELLLRLDRSGLVLAFNSFAKKRETLQRRKKGKSFWQRMRPRANSA